MNMGLGPDFQKARLGELYSARSGQRLWLVGLFVVVLFIVMSLVQTVVGFAVLPLVNGVNGVETSFADQVALQGQLVKSTIVGLLPASLLVAYVAWKLARVANLTGETGIPLHVPRLGMAGWALVVGGLLAFLWAAFALTFLITGIDPQTYAPSNDPNSAAGMVEKVMADLSDEPILFALALPGITLAVPLAEELIFRGALFSALRNSWFGKTGAVIISAAAWALVHAMAAPWLFVFIIFVMGLALGWLLLRFGSLSVTIVCHACWNMFSSLVIFGGQVSQ